MRYFCVIAIFVMAVFYSGCEKDAEVKPKDYPYVIIEGIDMQADNYVTFNAQVFYSGDLEIIDHGFAIRDVALNPDYELFVVGSMGACNRDIKQFHYTIKSGLVKGMKYSVRAFTKTSENVVYSNELIFKSPVGLNYSEPF
ncbi:MAG: hypothetical protein JW783_04315 [Bacteroidales bacterium]|nr:hypothetical protein [Bacteroidales bacterium]MBN2750183.1 hypothetical protein [Bacteroidales bacterium]